ncbi:hypothetical protein ACJ41O_015030 [Fusarium nematophilum]
MDSGPEFSSWKYFPFDLGESEDLENYEPGGFHPVHLGDVYDDRYRVVHKLGYGGFSTVWLATDVFESPWFSLKIVAARESPTYQTRSVIADHLDIPGSRLFAVADRHFWIDGPNGRHLCLVYPVLGPDVSRLSRGIYSRLKSTFARQVSLQAARALVQLHSKGLCHRDFTASNMLLRLNDEFDSYKMEDLDRIFGRPQTAPLETYSGKPPGPHGPDYIVVPLDFGSATTNVLSSEICVIDFDQSFTTTTPPSERPGIPAKYLAAEVAAGRPPSPASDIWALGCAIFRLRSGDDLFFDYDTNCAADALRQIVKTMGQLPENLSKAKFDEDGFPVADGQDGDSFWTLDETRSLEDRVRAIIDEPPSLFINKQGEAEKLDEEPAPARFEDEAAMRVPYSPALSSMAWKPTAVCIAGGYFIGYSEDMETDEMLEAFPKISDGEVKMLVDLLPKMFRYDPAKRITAEEVVEHPWFKL